MNTAFTIGRTNDRQPIALDLPRLVDTRMLVQANSGGEKEILKAVLDAYPHWIDRDRVSEITGYKRSSRDTYIQRLGARHLLQSKPAAIKASDTLFE